MTAEDTPEAGGGATDPRAPRTWWSERLHERVERFRGRARRPVSGPLMLAVGFLVGVLVATVAATDSGTVRVEGGSAADGALDEGASATAPVESGRPDGSGGAPASRGSSGGGATRATGGGGPADTAGGAAPQPVDEGTTGSAAGEGGAGADQGPEVRGVTADTVKIGVGVLDIGALSHLGPEFDNGDGEEHMRAWLEGVRRDGLLPIHGRDLELVYRRYAPSSVDPASQREACVGFVQDDEVFAVLAASNYRAGSECVAREHRTPLLTSDGVPEEAYERSHPFLFTFMMSETRLLRNWIHWGHHEGHLPGRTLGLYHESSAYQQNLVETAIEPSLEELGYELAARHTTDQPLGGPQDAVAVQKFQTAGVDLAMLLTSRAGFQQQAEAQGYRPDYIESDFFSGTTNTAASTYPPSQWDGTPAMSGMRYGEWKAGMPQSEPARKCVEYYEEHSGEHIDPNEREAEWIGMNKLCDSGWAMLEALRAAGPELTPESFVRGMESIRDLTLGVHLDVSFEPTRHHGTDVQRTLRWTIDCECWKAESEVGPLWVR